MANPSLLKYLKTAGYITANRWQRTAHYPFYASYKITYECNFRCKFCNVWRERTPDLPTEGVKRVIDNLAHSSILVLSLEGGDPLLRDDILEILRHIHTKGLEVFITTSEKNLDKYPMNEYAKYLNYLHISVDEGHNNLFMFDRLPEFTRWGIPITIQIVVTKNDTLALEEKIKSCYECGAKAVVMPAVHLDKTMNYFPDTNVFSSELLRLRKKYSNTIVTPQGFLKGIKTVSCDTSSIIIDSDGNLFYPCLVKGEKAVNLTETNLMDFLASEQAEQRRIDMKKCRRHCLWYQYFATQFYTQPRYALSSLMPYIAERLGFGPTRRRKRIIESPV